MNRDAVTLLTSRGKPVNKEFILQPDGTVDKRMAKNDGFFVADTKPVPDLQAMADILHLLAEDPTLTLSLGVFKKAPAHEFCVEPHEAIARRLGVDPKDRDAWAGFHEFDGKLYVARAKVNMEFSPWLLLDRDIVKGMPPELEALDRDRWLAQMARLLPGLDKAGSIIVPSSSSRVCLNGVRRESSSWHLFVQVSDPEELPRVWPQVLVKSFATPLEPDAPPWEGDPITLGFRRPKYSREEGHEGEVVQSQPWSIYDPSTCSPERLVFDGQPTIRGEGLTLLPPQVLVKEGDRLDLGAFQDITEEEAEKLEKQASITVEFKRETKAGGKVKIASVNTISRTLSPDLEIETKEYGKIAVAELQAKARTTPAASRRSGSPSRGRLTTARTRTARRPSSIAAPTSSTRCRAASLTATQSSIRRTTGWRSTWGAGGSPWLGTLTCGADGCSGMVRGGKPTKRDSA
jgi:hypothetical protein